MQSSTLRHLRRRTLREADPEKVSSITGIAEARLHDYIGHLK